MTPQRVNCYTAGNPRGAVLRRALEIGGDAEAVGGILGTPQTTEAEPD